MFYIYLTNILINIVLLCSISFEGFNYWGRHPRNTLELLTRYAEKEFTDGSNLSLYLARGCQRSYCRCRLLPIVSTAFCGLRDIGSIQHSLRAQGCVLVTSGGSTPTLRQITSATETVFIRSRILQVCISRSSPVIS